MAISPSELVTGVETEDMRGSYRAASQASPPQAADLPASTSSKRWGAHRKAGVVAAVARGVLTRDEACTLHAISLEEFISWQRDIALRGLAGLRINGVQRRHRQPSLPRQG